jgi:hypothetical protein
VKKAPTAADLFGKGEDYWLDFPGDPLDAGCSYEELLAYLCDASAALLTTELTTRVLCVDQHKL